MEIKVGRPLRSGDRVAIVAPASPMRPERLEGGIGYLREWGLDVEVMPAVFAGHPRLGYLTAEDSARAKDFRDAWLDPAFAAVLAGRGGYGVQRLLELLDFDELTAVPKLFLGFSDITALHEPLNARGLVTIHGPVVSAIEEFDCDVGRERVRQLLFEPWTVTDLLAPAGARSVVGGVAEGVLRGGNLALLAASIGTPTYAPPAGVVVMEDVGEHPYRVDRMLTQLLRAGWFAQVTGLVIGSFDDASRAEPIHTTIRDRLQPLGVPMVEGVAIGHQDLNLAVPLGLPVRLDADAGTLRPLWDAIG